MKEQFVPYEIALAMKELGFDESCLAFHSEIHGLLITSPTQNVNEIAGEVLAPLYQQAFDWFRERYDWYYELTPHEDSYDWAAVIYPLTCIDDPSHIGNDFLSYEDARLACLEELIEIIK